MNSSRRLVLTVLSVIIIAFFFSIEYYNEWIKSRVIGPVTDISNQLAYMEPQERLVMRLGSGYIVSYNVADFMRKNKQEKGALILLPPVEYLQKNKVDFPVPEPAIFYYYTGLKSVTVNNKGSEKANFAIVYYNNNLQLVPLNDQNRKEIMDVFRQFKN